MNKMNIKSALGVSNVSFGLPNRALLNRSFLLMAMENGLNLPIINPNDSVGDQIKFVDELMYRYKRESKNENK